MTRSALVHGDHVVETASGPVFDVIGTVAAAFGRSPVQLCEDERADDFLRRVGSCSAVAYFCGGCGHYGVGFHVLGSLSDSASIHARRSFLDSSPSCSEQRRYLGVRAVMTS